MSSIFGDVLSSIFFKHIYRTYWYVCVDDMKLFYVLCKENGSTGTVRYMYRKSGSKLFAEGLLKAKFMNR